MTSRDETPTPRYQVWLVEFLSAPGDEKAAPALARIVGQAQASPLSRREAKALTDGFNHETVRHGGNRRAFVWPAEAIQERNLDLGGESGCAA